MREGNAFRELVAPKDLRGVCDPVRRHCVDLEHYWFFDASGARQSLTQSMAILELLDDLFGYEDS